MSSSEAARTPEAGGMLGRKYRVVRPLGRGGMGVVLEAENTATGARVAIKLLQKALADDPEHLSRFMREARATARLRSRFIVTIYDVDQDDEGSPYIVMELLEGRDLAGELRERGQVPTDELLGWMIQAAAGLARAHEDGIIHRDLKPGNLFLTSGPAAVVKVVDFGVSKMVSETELTLSGDVLGTIHYMSPEQLRDSKNVDGRADIWALGIIMYRALEGRMPFEGSRAEVIAKILGDSALQAQRADVPPAVAAAVVRALEKDPDNRFASMAAFANALAPFARMTPPVSEALAELTHTTPVRRAPAPAPSAPSAPSAPAPMAAIAETVLAPAVQATPQANAQPSMQSGAARSGGAVGFIMGALAVLVIFGLGFFAWRRHAEPLAPASSAATAAPSASASASPSTTPSAAASSSPAASEAASTSVPIRVSPSATTSATASSRRPPPPGARPTHAPSSQPFNPARL